MENIDTQYKDFTTAERRAITLDYIFMNMTKHIKPSEFRKFYNIDSRKFTKNISRNFIWFEKKYVIWDEKYCEDSDYKNSSIIKNKDGNFSNSNIDIKDAYNKSYILNTNRVTYKIPSDSLKRYNYSIMVTSLLMSFDNAVVEDIPMINVLNEMIKSNTKEFMSGIIRDTFLSVNVYDYFKNKKGSMLSILMELSHYNQQISLEIKSEDSMTQIEKTIVKKVIINEDSSVKLKLPNMSIKLKSLDEITNIFILSKNYPTTKGGSPLMNKKTFIESVQKSDNIGKMKDSFVKIMGDLQSEIEDEVDMDFNKYMENLLKDKVNGLNIIERGNRRIKIVS